MNKNEFFLILFLYCLVILLSQLNSHLRRIETYSWAKTLLTQLKEPSPESPPAAQMKPIHAARLVQKHLVQRQLLPALTLHAMITAKGYSTETRKLSKESI